MLPEFGWCRTSHQPTSCFVVKETAQDCLQCVLKSWRMQRMEEATRWKCQHSSAECWSALMEVPFSVGWWVQDYQVPEILTRAPNGTALDGSLMEHASKGTNAQGFVRIALAAKEEGNAVKKKEDTHRDGWRLARPLPTSLVIPTIGVGCRYGKI